jgi:hypothetical protein
MSDDGREILAALVRHLRRGDASHGPAAFAVKAIQGFLDGDHLTLDAAFGICPRARGRPKARKYDKNFATASKAFDMKNYRGMDWPQICDELGLKDVRELRRIYKRFYKAVLQDEAKAIIASLRGGD